MMSEQIVKILRAAKERLESHGWCQGLCQTPAGECCAAINVTLCLASGGGDRVAEGFNNDIAISGENFGLQPSHRARPCCSERA
jgi:hypothetical protein